MVAEALGLPGMPTVVAVAVAAVATAALHGATGLAGGLLMAAFIAPIVGTHQVVPVMTIALLVSHSSRAILNFGHLDRRAFWNVIVPALPFTVLVALNYQGISGTLVAFLMGTILLVSVPVRRLAQRLRVRLGMRGLRGAGAFYGTLAGAAVGPGIFLSPFLLGCGIVRESFVATIAAIALVTNVVRLGLFGATDIYTSENVLLALFIGVLTVPGNWVGRAVLRRMSTRIHVMIVELFVLLGAVQFYYLGAKGLV